MQAQIRLGRIFARFHISSSRFTPLPSKSQDIYFNYSLAGPTFISKTTIDTYEPANSSPSRISWAWERRRISNIDGRIGRA